MKPKPSIKCCQEATKKAVKYGQSDLDEVSSLREHLAWALDEICDGDYSTTPKHDCEFATNPEKGYCRFCWDWWSAVEAVYPNKTFI